MSDLTIAVLLPDVLGTYSDAGNAVVLAQRARWRGIDAEIIPVPARDSPPASCEVYLLGGGEDTAQAFAAQWLAGHPHLVRAMSGTAVTLAVCAGLQILGTTFTDVGGRRRDGAGVLDVSTAPGRSRAVGQVVTDCLLPGVGALTGFENHRGVSVLGPDARPLGRLVRGRGNGAGGVDGATAGGVVATYLHGPVLARNPALADHLLQRATGRSLGPIAPAAVPDQDALRRTYLPVIRRVHKPMDLGVAGAAVGRSAVPLRSFDRAAPDLDQPADGAGRRPGRGPGQRLRLALLLLLSAGGILLLALALAGVRW